MVSFNCPLGILFKRPKRWFDFKKVSLLKYTSNFQCATQKQRDLQRQDPFQPKLEYKFDRKVYRRQRHAQ